MIQYGHKGPGAHEVARGPFIGASESHRDEMTIDVFLLLLRPSARRPHCLAERRTYTPICHADR